MTTTQRPSAGADQESADGADSGGNQRPLAGSYAAAVAMALLGLSPFIVLSTAVLLLQKQLITDLHTSRFLLQLADALANATYAFGAVAAADLIKRIPARRLYQGAEVLFIAGSLIAVFGGGIGGYFIGRLLQGLGTGLLLVAALPPLVQRFGAKKLPVTAAVINLGLFGMVTIGPLIGGYTATIKAWHGLFLIVAALAVVAVLLAQFAYEGGEESDPRMPVDFSGIPLAVLATVLPFFGVSWIARGGFGSPVFWLAVAAGLVALAVLIYKQYKKRESALMPLDIIAHTLPITGILAAMVAGAAVTAFLELDAQYLLKVAHKSPLAIGVILTSEVVGVAIAAGLFARAIKTRWLPVLALSGVGVTALGGIFVITLSPGRALMFVGISGFLTGFGAGAGVAPALFMAGLSAPSSKLGPTFAIVELLRSEAAYLIAPVLIEIAGLFANFGDGVRVAAIVMTAVTVAGGALSLAILLAGRKEPHTPDLEKWLDGEEPAYDSPPFLAGLRKR